MSLGKRFILEFPAVPGILGGLALAAATWPWWALHGVARWVTGPVWTVLVVAIASAVIAGRVKSGGASR